MILFIRYIALCFLVLCISISKIYTQEYKIVKAPINTDYRIEVNDTNLNDKLGYKAPPFKIPKFKKALKSVVVLDYPAQYDLRKINYASPVRDQGELNTCWSFGVIGAIESYLLQNHKKRFDLSEENMATCHGFIWDKSKGGNFFIATSYLSSMKGPVLEEDDPYIFSNTSTCKVEKTDPAIYIKESYWISKDNYNLKELLFNHGAIAVTMHYDDRFFLNSYNSYKCNDTLPENHIVLLVGWDDKKSTYFYSKNSSELDSGVWIARNSWGESWGDSGYFYVSYKDSTFGKNGMIIPEVQNKDELNFDTLLYYDELGFLSSVGYSNEISGKQINYKHAYGITKFTVNKPQQIKMIGTYTLVPNTLITIEIYESFNRRFAYNLLDSVKKATCKYAGYHTFKTNAIVEEDFYVKIKYTTPDFNYPIPVEMEIDDYANPDIEEEISWISLNGSRWDTVGKNVSDAEYDLCIRAYAENSYPIYKDVDDDLPVTIYPNPARDILNCEFRYITAEDVEIFIYNFYQKLIGSETYNQKYDNNSITFNISELPKGIYYLHIKSKEHTVVKKIIKM